MQTTIAKILSNNANHPIAELPPELFMKIIEFVFFEPVQFIQKFMRSFHPRVLFVSDKIWMRREYPLEVRRQAIRTRNRVQWEDMTSLFGTGAFPEDPRWRHRLTTDDFHQ